MDGKERAFWSVGTAGVVIGFVVAMVTIGVVRYTDVSKEPWLYLGVAVGILSAVGGGVLTLVRAHEVSE